MTFLLCLLMRTRKAFRSFWPELLFLAGLRPIVADKLRYYDDPEFAGSFDPA
jgi:hypothetical protein